MHKICTQVDTPNGISFLGTKSEWIPNKWNKKKITYCVARDSADIKGDRPEHFMINLAFQCWETELDLKFEQVRIDQKPDFNIQWVTRKQDPYFTSESILAYCGYPEGAFQGILRFNDDCIWTPDGKGLTAEQYTKLTGKKVDKSSSTFKTYNGNQTARHELGHGLGAVHVEDCKDCLLFTFYNKSLFPQKGDLEQLIPKYGKRVFKNSNVQANLRSVILNETINWKDKWELNI